MITLTPRHGLLAGLALILLSNAVALAGVWYNRQGQAESSLLLSERELLRDHEGPSRENSGLALRLDWRSPSPAAPSNRYERRPLQQEQLLALGFAPLDERDPDYRQRHGKRQVLVVLELDGPAYQAELRRAEAELQQASQALAQLPDDEQLQIREKLAREDLASERQHASRLFAIDVGLDAASLRQRYPDRSRYALVPGTVSAWCDCSGDVRQLTGQISQLHNSSLNVPHAWRSLLAERLPASYSDEQRPRFQARVNYGQRLEPWISAIHGLAE
ncbi:conserved hypothetical protein [Pseudomonas sp. 8AS]|uniref:DUF4824 family protein n=1 Tax=Pseudomonas sp. 8AS TaxID=2653163 RepID=UPI0012EF511B|nr:DUF4824 family protein [Pseudomonas sp. 8AS]VXB87180.1 conserved hypothetical protein [Pseudomonas sp. 8AS]